METPEIFQGGYYNTEFTPEKRLSDAKNGDLFVIDDLLDYPYDDGIGMVSDVADGTFDTTGTAGTSTDSSTGSAEQHFPGDGMGCRNFCDGQFSSELCVPYDDVAELEWLSNFVEESFSSEDLQKLHLMSGTKARTNEESGITNAFRPEPNRTNVTAMFQPEMSVPAKARSKRSRTAPCNWTSRLLIVSPSTTTTTTTTTMMATIATTTTTTMSSSPKSNVAPIVGKKSVKGPPRKKDGFDQNASMVNCEGRKCLHCATDKTPQWRTGPMGPKTLCNACGVRYKLGRLVPEYRPAASPTFVLTKHSNSHRKVQELRRQKEILRAQQHQYQQFLDPNMMFDVSSNGDDYLIHQHIGPHFNS